MDNEYIIGFVSKMPSGVSISITDSMGMKIVENYGIILKCNDGDISGEESGLFEYNNEIIRIKKTWTKRWELYHGEWKSDPNWTGD